MFHAEKDTHEEEDMERQKRQGAEYEFYGKLPLKNTSNECPNTRIINV